MQLNFTSTWRMAFMTALRRSYCHPHNNSLGEILTTSNDEYLLLGIKPGLRDRFTQNVKYWKLRVHRRRDRNLGSLTNTLLLSFTANYIETSGIVNSDLSHCIMLDIVLSIAVSFVMETVSLSWLKRFVNIVVLQLYCALPCTCSTFLYFPTHKNSCQVFKKFNGFISVNLLRFYTDYFVF